MTQHQQPPACLTYEKCPEDVCCRYTKMVWNASYLLQDWNYILASSELLWFPGSHHLVVYTFKSILEITSAQGIHGTGRHLRQEVQAVDLYLVCCLMAIRSKPKPASVATKTSPHLLSPPSGLTASVHKHLREDDCSPAVPCSLLIYSLLQGDFSQRDLYKMEDPLCGAHESGRKLLESLEQEKRQAFVLGPPGPGDLLGLTSHLLPLPRPTPARLAPLLPSDSVRVFCLRTFGFCLLFSCK